MSPLALSLAAVSRFLRVPFTLPPLLCALRCCLACVFVCVCAMACGRRFVPALSSCACQVMRASRSRMKAKLPSSRGTVEEPYVQLSAASFLIVCVDLLFSCASLCPVKMVSAFGVDTCVQAQARDHDHHSGPICAQLA